MPWDLLLIYGPKTRQQYKSGQMSIKKIATGQSHKRLHRWPTLQRNTLGKPIWFRVIILESLSDSEPLSGINKELPKCNNSLSDFKWAWAGVSGKAISSHMQGPELDHQQHTHTDTSGLVNISLNAYTNCQYVFEKNVSCYWSLGMQIKIIMRCHSHRLDLIL